MLEVERLFVFLTDVSVRDLTFLLTGVDNPEVADAPDVAPVPGIAVAIADAVAGGAVPFSVTPPPS